MPQALSRMQQADAPVGWLVYRNYAAHGRRIWRRPIRYIRAAAKFLGIFLNLPGPCNHIGKKISPLWGDEDEFLL